MSNFYETMLNNNLGRSLLKTAGLPTPIDLKRYNPSQETYFEGKVLVGACKNAALLGDLFRNLKASKATVYFPAAAQTAADILAAADKAGVRAIGVETKKGMKEKFDAFVFDASGFESGADLNQLYYFFNEGL